MNAIVPSLASAQLATHTPATPSKSRICSRVLNCDMWIMRRANIGRLMSGAEGKIGPKT